MDVANLLKMTKEIELLISDETLRDGQQQPYVTFQAKEMLDILRSIPEALGSALYNIDIMPSMHPLHKHTARYAIQRGIPITLATTMQREAIQQCGKIGSDIITISSLSDRLMAAKGLNRESNLLSTTGRISAARQAGLRVGLAGEDSASEDADLDFIAHYINQCSELIDYFIYCDTDGQANPEDTFNRVKYLVEETGKKVPIILHCHNDTRRAVDNTIQGILAGAKGISSTFTGIGDRAGNAATEEVLYRLKEEGLVVKGVDYDKVAKTAALVADYARRGPANPGSEMSKVHEAGIHIDALLKARKQGLSVYATAANEEPKVAFGISSGLSTLQLIYDMYRVPSPNKEDATAILMELKDLAISEKTSYSPLEVFAHVTSLGIQGENRGMATIPRSAVGAAAYRV